MQFSLWLEPLLGDTDSDFSTCSGGCVYVVFHKEARVDFVIPIRWVECAVLSFEIATDANQDLGCGKRSERIASTGK